MRTLYDTSDLTLMQIAVLANRIKEEHDCSMVESDLFCKVRKYPYLYFKSGTEIVANTAIVNDADVFKDHGIQGWNELSVRRAVEENGFGKVEIDFTGHREYEIIEDYINLAGDLMIGLMLYKIDCEFIGKSVLDRYL